MEKEIIGIIGGSGLGDSLAEYIEKPEPVNIETPFGKPSASIILGNLGERKIAFLNRHGDGHRFAPSEVPYAANIFALKKVGVRSIIATCAVGSLREEIGPGDLILVDQFIDKTFRRQTSFFDNLAAVHCEMAKPVCRRLHNMLLSAAEGIDINTHSKGTYICMEGPQFSTRAESLMHRSWGGDLIGMTAMPEAKLAREAQICYCLIALASDYDCWRPQEAEKDKQTLLKEIISNLRTASNNCLKLLKAVLETDELLTSRQCPCRKSLGLAVWTKEEKIDAEKRAKLDILFE